MKTFNAIIIDDERLGREYLSDLINEFIPEISVVGTAISAIEGFKLLTRFKIDIIFLDIEMPTATGFDFLEGLDSDKYKIVFTTAHSNYAVKAFKFNARGYLLKPVDLDDLQQLVSRFLLEEGKNENSFNLVLKTADSIIYINQKDIIRIEGEGNYTTVFCIDGSSATVSKGLKIIESRLTAPFFIKIHKSHIINKNFIKKYVKKEGGHFEMTDSSIIPLSRRRKEIVLNNLENDG